MISGSSPGAAAPPVRGGDLGGLIKELLVAWGCSLTWGGGIFFTIGAFLAWAFSGFPFSEPQPLTTLQGVVLGAGLILTLSSPVFMGAFLARSWRRGITSGLSALLVGTILLITSSLIISLPGNVIWDFFAENVAAELYFSTATGITAVMVITPLILMLMSTWVPPIRRVDGLGLGLIMGLGFSVASGFVLGRNLFAGDNVFHFIWQVPPLVWVSAVYFPELMAGRSGWKGFLVWALLILASFGLPFIVIPVLERVFG